MHWLKALLHFILSPKGENSFGLYGCGWNSFSKYLWSDWGNYFCLNLHTAWNVFFEVWTSLFYHIVVLNLDWQSFLFKLLILFILMKSNNWHTSARFLSTQWVLLRCWRHQLFFTKLFTFLASFLTLQSAVHSSYKNNCCTKKIRMIRQQKFFVIIFYANLEEIWLLFRIANSVFLCCYTRML